MFHTKYEFRNEVKYISVTLVFSEICITSSAKIINTKKKENLIKVKTIKAEGQKCPVCWKINKNGCERHSCSNKN